MELAMKHFELRFLDDMNRVAVTRALIGQDTLAAVAEAERLSDWHTVVEVWHGARRVASIKHRDLILATDQILPSPTARLENRAAGRARKSASLRELGI